MMQLFARCVGVMAFSKRQFEAVAADPVEWHVLLLSLVFGGLFAQRLVGTGSQDVSFFLIMGLLSGVGFVYASSYFLAWLLQLSGQRVAPHALRMVLGYSLFPLILGLVLIVLGDFQVIPKLSAINFVLIVLTWFLNIFGIKVVSHIPWVHALFVSVIPILALMLAIALLFKIAGMVYA
jgi:hypothetical protein